MTTSYYSWHPDTDAEFEPKLTHAQHSGTYWVHFTVSDGTQAQEVSIFFRSRKARQLWFEQLRYQVTQAIRKETK
jgi:hypothetical protein